MTHSLIDELQKKVQQKIEQLVFPVQGDYPTLSSESELGSRPPVVTQPLYEPIRYLLESSGKRIRPLLLLLVYRLFKEDLPEDAMNAALALELFHNFTLMHDDIMDEAPLRRNLPTVHCKWGVAAAILSGDALLIESYALLGRCSKHLLPALLCLFTETAAEVCRGQQMDMALTHVDVSTADPPQALLADYLEMIRLKTAVLLAAAMKMGAIIAGASDSDEQALYQLGLDLGKVFQLQDDFLDVYGNPGKTGKRLGGDLLAKKQTFLLIKALELADAPTKTILNQHLAAPAHTDIKEKDKIKNITEIYNRLDLKVRSEELLVDYRKQVNNSLGQLSVKEESKKALTEFIDTLMNRTA